VAHRPALADLRRIGPSSGLAGLPFVGQAVAEQPVGFRGPGLGSAGAMAVEVAAMLQGADPEWVRSPPTGRSAPQHGARAQAISGLHLLSPQR